MTKFKNLLIAFLLMLAGHAASAQGSFTVTLTLADQQTNEPVGFATVSLTEKGESKAAKYILSNSEGEAEITKVRKGTYVLKAEIM